MKNKPKKPRLIPNTKRGKAGGKAVSTRGRRGIIERKLFHPPLE